MAGVEDDSSTNLEEQIEELPPKERFEVRKLQAEIAELRRSPLRDLKFWRDLLGIVAVVFTVVYSSIEFLAQHRAKQRFEVTREVIELVEKLHGPDKEERQSAAILLAAWGEHALPILLRSVDAERHPGFSGLAQALTIIGRERPGSVLDPLRKRARYLFDSVLSGDKDGVDPLLNHIVLLGDLASLGDQNASRQLLSSFARDLRCEDEEWPNDSKVPKVDWTAICLHLHSSILKTGGE
jgi:hypothetical protein